MKIAAKINIAFVVMALALVSITASIQYIIARKSLEAAIFSHLETATEARSDELALYINMVKMSATQLSKSVVIEVLLKTPKDDPKWAEAFESVMTRLARTKAADPFIFEYMVLDLSGKVIASSDPASIGEDKSADSYFVGGQKGVYVKDAYYSEVKKMDLMGVSAPVTDSMTGALRGVLAVRVRLDALYRIVTNNVGLGKSGEAYIVNKYGFMITPSRFLKDTFLKQKVDTENVRQCIEDRGIHTKGYDLIVCPDYRGVPVLGMHAYIPEMQWVLCVELDRGEAFRPLMKMGWVMEVLLILAFLAAWFGAHVIAVTITEPIHRLHRGAEIIGEGNFDYKVATNANDEIGQLSRAFDTMTEELKKKTASIDSLNAEMAMRMQAQKRLAKNEERVRKIAQLEAALLDSGAADVKLKKITDGIVSVFGADFCRVWVIAPGDRCGSGCPHAAATEGPHVCRFRDRCLHLVASSGRYIHTDGGAHARVPFGCYKIGGIASGEYPSFLTNDVQNDPRVHNHEWAKELGLVSFVGFQLRPPHGEIIGVLALFSTHPISSDEFALLEGISSATVSVIQASAKESEIRESENKFKTMFEGSKDAIMMLTPTLGFFDANRATLELFGCKDRQQFISVGPAELSPKYQPDGKLSAVKSQEMIAIAMAKGLNFFDWTHKRIDGKEFYATVLLTRMDIKGEQVLQATVRDITETKLAAAKVAEAVEVKSQFISTVSHELRTPMTAIKEGIGIVLDGSAGPVSEDQKEFLGLAKRNVDRLARLINDVLDYQKLEAGRTVFRMQKADINSIVEDMIKVMTPVAKTKGLSLETHLAPGLPETIFDKDKIMQVLINLVNNAIKFTVQGGVAVTTSLDERHLLVSIKDTGVGIKKEDIPKLFRGFSQLDTSHIASKGSTGLGLAISKAIVQEHGGRIWIESEPGKGSDFKFTLPVKTKYKVLLVDDEKDVLTIYGRSLEQAGYEVSCAEKGVEAIAMVRKNKPDILILDMKLGDINGYEVMGHLRGNRETSMIPILAMSGYSEELQKLEDKREDSALASIAKPFKFEDLLAKIRTLLKQEA